MEFFYAYRGTPLMALLMLAFGITLQSIIVHWACSVCTSKHITFLRAASLVMVLGATNIIGAQVLQHYGVHVKSTLGICACIVFSTALLSALVPTDPVKAFLVLIISVGLTTVAATVFAFAGSAFFIPTLG